MYPQSMFRAKIRKTSQFFSEKYRFYSREKLQYITWACFRNDVLHSTRRVKTPGGIIYIKLILYLTRKKCSERHVYPDWCPFLSINIF